LVHTHTHNKIHRHTYFRTGLTTKISLAKYLEVIKMTNSTETGSLSQVKIAQGDIK
jgi:hypothetical protein